MYMGKDLTEVRSLHRPLVPDTVGPELHEPTFLQAIANKAKVDPQHRFRDLYRQLDAGFLLHCWGELNRDAASGVDQMTVAEYEQDLPARLEALEQRLKAKAYRAQKVRRVYVDKGNGKQRPLGIPALEDKLVQKACAKLLAAIYEEDFVERSYGYREGRGALEAVRDVTFDLQYGVFGYVVEADIKGFFDHLDHNWLLKMIEQRVDDRAFLKLIRKWLKAGVVDTDGTVSFPQAGTPQGGVISPVLANVYLHYALDLWFERVVKRHCRGEARMYRFADDWVCAFRFGEDAERFYRVLPKRLAKFGLELAPDKTRILRFSRFHPGMERRFRFLGFEFFWMPDRKGVARVKRRTDRKKFHAACGRIKEWIRDHRHLPVREFFAGLNRRLRGHYNYYGVCGNSQALYRFYDWAKECAFKWLNRRGGKKRSYTWEKFVQVCGWLRLAKPRITEVPRLRSLA